MTFAIIACLSLCCPHYQQGPAESNFEKAVVEVAIGNAGPEQSVAIELLGLFSTPRREETLELLVGRKWETGAIRRKAINSLAANSSLDGKVLDVITRASCDKDANVRRDAIAVLGSFSDRRSERELIGRLRFDSDTWCRIVAAQALARRRASGLEEYLVALIGVAPKDAYGDMALYPTLPLLQRQEFLGALERFLGSDVKRVRVHAAEPFVRIADATNGEVKVEYREWAKMMEGEREWELLTKTGREWMLSRQWTRSTQEEVTAAVQKARVVLVGEEHGCSVSIRRLQVKLVEIIDGLELGKNKPCLLFEPSVAESQRDPIQRAREFGWSVMPAEEQGFMEQVELHLNALRDRQCADMIQATAEKGVRHILVLRGQEHLMPNGALMSRIGSLGLPWTVIATGRDFIGVPLGLVGNGVLSGGCVTRVRGGEDMFFMATEHWIDNREWTALGRTVARLMSTELR